MKMPVSMQRHNRFGRFGLKPPRGIARAISNKID